MFSNMSPLDIPKNPVNRREWIKYQLRIRGTSLSAIARELCVGRQQTSRALAEPNSTRADRAIAAKLGLKPNQLFPERYAANGKPNRRIGRPRKSHDKSTSRSAVRNVNTRRVG